jgi:hypothetical protein
MTTKAKSYKSVPSSKQAQSLKHWWSNPENRERMRKAHIGRHTKSGWHQNEAACKRISRTLKRYWATKGGENKDNKG